MQEALQARIQNVNWTHALAAGVVGMGTYSFFQICQAPVKNNSNWNSECKITLDHIHKLELEKPPKHIRYVVDRNIAISLLYLQQFQDIENNRQHFSEIIHDLDRFCELRNTFPDVPSILNRNNKRDPNDLLVECTKLYDNLHHQIIEMRLAVEQDDIHQTQFDASKFFGINKEERKEVSNWLYSLSQKKTLADAFSCVSGAFLEAVHEQYTIVFNIFDQALNISLSVPNLQPEYHEAANATLVSSSSPLTFEDAENQRIYAIFNKPLPESITNLDRSEEQMIREILQEGKQRR